MFAVIRARFREELDYELEASRLARFAELHAGDPTVRVPGLVEVAQRAAGPHDGAGARRHLRRGLLGAAGRAPGVGGDDVAVRLQGHPAGRDAQRRPAPGQLHLPPRRSGHVPRLRLHPGDRGRAPRERRAGAPRGARSRRGGLRASGGRARERRSRARSRSSPSRTRESASSPSSTRRTTSAGATRRPGRRDEGRWRRPRGRSTPDEFFPMPADMVFVNRLQFGFYSVLARLDVEVDYAAVERSFLGIATAAPRAPTPAIPGEGRTPRTRSA